MGLVEEKMNIISIKEDAVVNVAIGGQFYQRLNAFVLNFAESRGQDEMLTAIAKIQRKQTHTDKFAFDLETMLQLVGAIEQEFKDKGHTIDNEVTIEVPEEVRDSYQNKLKS